MLKLPYLALKHKLKRNAKGERERENKNCSSI